MNTFDYFDYCKMTFDSANGVVEGDVLSKAIRQKQRDGQVEEMRSFFKTINTIVIADYSESEEVHQDIEKFVLESFILGDENLRTASDFIKSRRRFFLDFYSKKRPSKEIFSALCFFYEGIALLKEILSAEELREVLSEEYGFDETGLSLASGRDVSSLFISLSVNIESIENEDGILFSEFHESICFYGLIGLKWFLANKEFFQYFYSNYNMRLDANNLKSVINLMNFIQVNKIEVFDILSVSNILGEIEHSGFGPFALLSDIGAYDFFQELYSIFQRQNEGGALYARYYLESSFGDDFGETGISVLDFDGISKRMSNAVLGFLIDNIILSIEGLNDFVVENSSDADLLMRFMDRYPDCEVSILINEAPYFLGFIRFIVEQGVDIKGGNCYYVEKLDNPAWQGAIPDFYGQDHRAFILNLERDFQLERENIEDVEEIVTLRLLGFENGEVVVQSDFVLSNPNYDLRVSSFVIDDHYNSFLTIDSFDLVFDLFNDERNFPAIDEFFLENKVFEINDTQFQKLLVALKSRSIKSLYVCDQFIKLSPKTIDALPSDIEQLGFYGNEISDSGVKNLAKRLKDFPNLKFIDFRENFISEEGRKVFERAILKSGREISVEW